MKIEIEKFVIMDKNRTLIAKGVPRNRYLVMVDDINDKKRILYYDSFNKAKSAYECSGFYKFGIDRDYKYELEPVKVKITIEEVK